MPGGKCVNKVRKARLHGCTHGFSCPQPGAPTASNGHLSSPSSHRDTCPPRGQPGTAAPAAAGKQRTGPRGKGSGFPHPRPPAHSVLQVSQGAPGAGPLSPRHPSPTGRVRELSPRAPRTPRTGSAGENSPENEGRQSRGAAGGSPAQELQDSGSGVPPRPQHS